MQYINNQVEDITPSLYDLESAKRFIEQCGRTCYDSADRITEDSYKQFFDMLIKRGHLSVLEHATIYLYIPFTDHYHHRALERDPHTFIRTDYHGNQCITTNLRVLVENGWYEDVKRFICDKPTSLHIRRFSFRITTSIATARELNRHRTLSISERSTRYVKANKKMMSFIVSEEQEMNINYMFFLSALEQSYTDMIDQGVKTEQARVILPLCTATEVVYTAFESDWKAILNLRSSKAGAHGQHPECNEVANMIYDLIEKRNGNTDTNDSRSSTE